MLQSIRNTAGSWIVKILFVLLILSFGVWGIGDIFRRSQSDLTVAEVGDVKIAAPLLDQEFRSQMERLRQIFGGQFDAEQARSLGLLDQALERIVQRTLYDLAAADAGLLVSDEMVRQRIAQEPAFQNQLRQFDAELFRRVLAANNLSEPAYVGLIRREMARAMMIGAVTSGARAPDQLAADLYRHQQEKRVADLLFIPSAAFSGVGIPDEATQAAFHEERAIRFTAPEYRALSIAQLTVDDLSHEVSVSEDELRAAYDARADEFRTPQRRTIAQVLVQDEATARKVAEAARSANSFAAAAQAAGAEVLDLGKVTEGELPPELAKPVFGLPPGGVSAPIQSDLGWHVMAVTDIEPAHERSFAEVRDELHAAVRREKAMDSLFEFSNKLDDLLAGGATLEEAAQKMNLKVTRIDAVDSSGKRPDGQAVAGVPSLPLVLKAAFALGEGQATKLTETPEGNYFVARVDKATPPKLRPLNEVRDQVIAAWQAEQQAKLAAAKAEEVAQYLRNGVPPQVIAANLPGTVPGATEPMTRTGANRGKVPAELVQKLFEMQTGEVAHAATADGQMVVRLREVRPADPAAAGAEMAQLKDGVTQQIAADLLDQFSQALRRKYPVEFHRSTLDSLYKPS